MKLTEILNLVQEKTKDTVNQSMIAKALNVTRQTISNRVRSNSELTISELEKIEEFFNIKLFGTGTESDSTKVDYYPDVFASCGSGVLAFSEEKEVVTVPKTLFSIHKKSAKYSLIHAKGDSMFPTINDGDKLLIEHWDNNQITDNKVYVFCYKSEIFVKRLSKNLDEIIIKSDNPNYSTRTVKGDDMNDITLIGQIVGIVREL